MPKPLDIYMTNIFEILNSSEKLFTIQSNGRERELSDLEKNGTLKIFEKFNNSNFLNLYRGVGNTLISQMLNTNNIKKGIQLFFLIGEKSAYFHRDLLEFQFNKLKELLEELIKMDIDKYLSTPIQIDTWLEKIEKLVRDNPYKLKLIYLHYCQFFHIEDIRISYHQSMLMSTTTNYSVAQRFTQEYDENGLILFIVKPKNKLYQTTNFNQNLLNELSQNEIPFIRDFNPLESENEVNFMFGIYPQCIFAIQDTNTHKIYINPHFIDCLSDNEKLKYLLSNQEIFIDQECFDDVLKTTNFKRYSTPDTLEIFPRKIESS